jgi:Major Facilitator Superfamily
VVVERRSPAPLVPSSILRVPRAGGRRPGRGHAAGRAGALLFLGTLHLQQVLGYTALRTGLAYLALSLPVVAASPAAACLVTRLGRRSVAVAGLLLQAAGLLLLLRITPGGGFLTQILPGFVLVGAGPPIAWVPLTAAAVDGVGDRSGLAAGIFNTAQQVGNALALAALRLRAGVEGGPGPPLQRSTRGPGPPPSGRAPVDGPNRPPACR